MAPLLRSRSFPLAGIDATATTPSLEGATNTSIIQANGYDGETSANATISRLEDVLDAPVWQPHSDVVAFSAEHLLDEFPG